MQFSGNIIDTDMNIKRLNIPNVVYFVATALLIAYFFPREGKFRYQFHEGKPWRYGLLTATSDFPIYKTQEEIKQEQDSALKKFSPYFKIDLSVSSTQTDKLGNDFNNNRKGSEIPREYVRYISEQLSYIYQSGILSSDELIKLKENKYEQIFILENAVAKSVPISNLFTTKTAYEYILNNAPLHFDKNKLQSCNINNYLTYNLSYDKDMSDKVKDDILRSVSISSGMVQAGERIVDRGEIVDTHTYNVLRSLKTVYESKTGGDRRHSIMLAGQFVLVCGIIFCFWFYLWFFRPKIFHKRKNVFFLLCCIFMCCFLTEFCVAYGLFNIYILPYAIVPIVVRTFFDSRTALFTHLITVLICSVMAPFPHEFILMQTIAGMVVIFSLKDLSQRSELIRCAFFIFLSYVLTYISLVLYQEGDFLKINWMMFLYLGINFILLMFAYVLVYMLEKTFGYISNITLVELSNINMPLLKKLSETCPGTFQHSLQVSILAAEAAGKINANAQLVRTGALYHDVGKMTNPVFFTENQNNVNPHNQLSFDESARIVISHVSEGVKIAEKYNLPEAIINFIRTHHGKGKAKYFYNSFKNQYPDRKIDESVFTYPGPNPFSKETAVLMMADSVEAASRSLKEHSEEEIQALVNKIIDGQIADGLLKNAPLTYKDVETVKQVFIDKLKMMYHTRISYPDLKKD